MFLAQLIPVFELSLFLESLPSVFMAFTPTKLIMNAVLIFLCFMCGYVNSVIIDTHIIFFTQL